MNETYTTIDTFSIDTLNQSGQDLSKQNHAMASEDSSKSNLKSIPVIARVPNVNSVQEKPTPSQSPLDNRGQVYSRIDKAIDRQPHEPSRSKPVTTIPDREVDAFEAIRSADLFLGTQQTRTDSPRIQGAAAPPARSTPLSSRKPTANSKVTQEQSEGLTDLWVLQAEAAIAPYTKWIVLAVVLAALTLALVLVQGNKPQTIDPADSLLFAESSNSAKSIEVPSNAGTLEPMKPSPNVPSTNYSVVAQSFPVPSKNDSLSEGVIVNRPVGLPPQPPQLVVTEQAAEKNLPQAEFVGQIVPIEPYRTTNTRVANRVNQAPSGYPSTRGTAQTTFSNKAGSQVR